MVCVAILYRSEGSALPVATLTDRRIIETVARKVIADRRKQAEELVALDWDLGLIAAEEVSRLEHTLQALIGFAPRAA
jgi:hypothetical protein